MKKKYIILLIIYTILSTTISYAHSGRTDANGGHYDRSTGEYHYHSGGSTNYESFNTYNNDITLNNNTTIENPNPLADAIISGKYDNNQYNESSNFFTYSKEKKFEFDSDTFFISIITRDSYSLLYYFY